MIFSSTFPLITDVTMCDKNNDEDDHKTVMSAGQMRQVLEDLGNDSMTEAATDEDDDDEEFSEFNRVLAEIPDLEGDYSELSLGFNEELCLGAGGGQDDQSSKQSSLHTPPSSSLPSTPTKDVTRKITGTKQPVVEVKIKSQESVNASVVTEDSQDESEDDKVLTLPTASSSSSSCLAPAVPIHRGDLIEFLVSDKTWFLVEVTGRGKIGGKNQNYLNVKYSDGSEGGVFIDQHQWRIVKRREMVMEDSPEGGGAGVSRLHRVTLDMTSSCDDSTEADTTTDDDHDTRDKQASVVSTKSTRKRKKRRKRREKMRKISVDETVFEPSNNIKRGDIIEYVVKEQDEKVTINYSDQ